MSFKTKQDQVADILRERIIAGEYERGAKLKQADIARELGVSITPVREALHMLEAEGYVVGVSHKGLLVPKLVAEQLREIYELRVALERDLTRHAVANLTAGRLAHLRDLERAAERASVGRDHLARRVANYRFHFALYEIAGRPQALQFVRVLWAKYPFLHQERGGRSDGLMVEEHERLMAEMERRDEEGAAIAMVQHISNGWETFLSASIPAVVAHDEPAMALSR